MTDPTQLNTEWTTEYPKTPGAYQVWFEGNSGPLDVRLDENGIVHFYGIRPTSLERMREIQADYPPKWKRLT